MNNLSYRVREIPKEPRRLVWQNKAGQTRSRLLQRPPRLLQIPSDSLKQRQYDLIIRLNAMKVSDAAHGFVSGRSVKTNAEVHLGAPCLLSMDLRDFFPSVTSAMILKEMRHRGLSVEDAQEIVEACTLDGVLPQGAPTSPVLANLVAREMDCQLIRLSKELKIKYTRYADDLTFSGKRDMLDLAKPRIQSIINRCGFRINGGKTKTMASYREMEITGAVINNGLDVPLSRRLEVAAIMRQVNQQKIFSRERFEKQFGSFDVFLGQVSYMAHLNPKHKGKFYRLKKIARGGHSHVQASDCPS